MAFDLFNDPLFCAKIGWSQQRIYQPADVIKLLIYQLLHGYSDVEHLFLHLEQVDILWLKDHLGIPQKHDLPSAHHFAEIFAKLVWKSFKSSFISSVMKQLTSN